MSQPQRRPLEYSGAEREEVVGQKGAFIESPLPVTRLVQPPRFVTPPGGDLSPQCGAGSQVMLAPPKCGKAEARG